MPSDIDPLETTSPLPGSNQYSSTAIALHWIMSVLVVVVGTLGLLHDSWPKATQKFWINIHAVLGLLLFGLLFVRAWWRIRHPPPLRANVGGYFRVLAGPVHWALYGLLFVIPIIGIVTFAYHGRVLDFGLFRIDPGIKSNRSIFHPTEDIHGYLACGLFALAGLHGAAALWHQFYLRDGTMWRMWPRARR